MNADVKAELVKTEQPVMELIQNTPTERALTKIANLRKAQLLESVQDNITNFYCVVCAYFDRHQEFRIQPSEFLALEDDEIESLIRMILERYKNSSWWGRFF